MNVVLLPISTESLSELSNLYYCAACVVTEESEDSLKSNINISHSIASWEIRLRNKLKKLLKDLSWLYEFSDGKLSKFKSSKLDKVYNLSNHSVIEICEEVQQSIRRLNIDWLDIAIIVIYGSKTLHFPTISISFTNS